MVHIQHPHYHLKNRVHRHHHCDHPDYEPSRMEKILDKLIYVVGIFGPVMTLPQVYTIWISQNASGVSMISWCAYLFTALAWLAYGVFHNVKPIIFSNIIWVILDLIIILGVFRFG